LKEIKKEPKMKTLLTAAALVLGCGSLSLSATPFDNPDKVPKNTTSSRVLGDTSIVGRLWVLPPQEGSAGKPVFSSETPDTTCNELSIEFKAQEDITKMIATLVKKQKSVIDAIDQLTDKNTDEAIKLVSRANALRKLIDEQKKYYSESIDEGAKKHGGSLLIPYTHQIDQNLQKIRDTNPNFSDIQRADTYNARFYFTAPGSVTDGADLSALPIIVDYGVGGLKAKDLAESKFQIPSKLDVTLSLTRLGACYFKFPEKFGAKPIMGFGMTAIYEFPYAFRSKVNASYNLLSIYKYLQQSGTSGGLFSSISWSNTIESNWGSSAFSITWSEEDPNSAVTPAQRLEIERTIKADLLANLDTLIRQKLNYSGGVAANPGPHGATVLAEGLEKGCAANGYCAAAAIALRALDAIFGSSSTSVSIERTLDVKATYSMNGVAARNVPRSIVYSTN
jgi:hypothetical protein